MINAADYIDNTVKASLPYYIAGKLQGNGSTAMIIMNVFGSAEKNKKVFVDGVDITSSLSVAPVTINGNTHQQYTYVFNDTDYHIVTMYSAQQILYGRFNKSEYVEIDISFHRMANGTSTGDAIRAFGEASKLKEVEIGDTTFLVGRPSSMFINCTNLETIHHIENIEQNNSTAANIASMFMGCPKLTFKNGVYKLNWVGSQFNQNTNYSSISLDHSFYGCEKLEELDFQGWPLEYSHAIGSCCEGCTGLKRILLNKTDTVYGTLNTKPLTPTGATGTIYYAEGTPNDTVTRFTTNAPSTWTVKKAPLTFNDKCVLNVKYNDNQCDTVIFNGHTII